MNFEKEYKKHIKNEGIKGALPHNLTDDILEYLLKEIEEYIQDNSKFPSMVLVPVLSIQGYLLGNFNKKEIHVNFESDEEMEKSFNLYVAWIVVEKSNRVNKVAADKDSQPTLENIFVNETIGL